MPELIELAPPTERVNEARTVAFEYEIRSDNADGMTLEGYAAVFDQPAPVVDWRGRYTETIQRGAFAKTLKEQRTPDLLFEHGRHPLIGRLPPGVIQKVGEDAHGLHFRARMFSSWLFAPVVEGVREHAIEGMSFEMYVPEDKQRWSADRSERSILEVALLPELTITMTPVYRGTEITLRSLRSLCDLDDAEVRAALEAARSGTSVVAPVIPEAAPLSTTVPQETLELWARSMRRRTA